MPKTFAAQTTVKADRSRDDIERELTRFGADGFSYRWQGNRSVVEFLYKNNLIRFVLDLPDRSQFAVAPKSARAWTPARAEAAWEQAKRQRWRSLFLIVKAKLVAVTDGIKTFEQEFGLDIVMADGKTVAEHVLPRIEMERLKSSPQLLLPAFVMEGNNSET